MEFVGVEYEGSLSPAKIGDTMPDVTWFPDARLNFAENLLRHGAPGSVLADAEAVVAVSEARERMAWTHAELRADAGSVARALNKRGVGPDDACGAYVANVGESIVAMLGATARGATW